MKKLSLLTTALLGFCLSSFSQSSFFEKVDFVGAMGSEDWTAKWSNFRPDTINYGSNFTNMPGTLRDDKSGIDITVNTTLTADKVYYMDNFVYVRDGVTLTIEPGTVIRSTKDDAKKTAGALIITRGAKIIAEGTKDHPIIFTSDKPVGQRNLGDWGGIMLFGKARQNQPKSINGNNTYPADFRETNFEVFAESNKEVWYGGNDDKDNSGILKYVRIEFAGWYQVVNSEINGLTFGAVGSGTTVDYVQCSQTNDDSFEWFGGAVNCKHLIAFAGIDDDFDTDCGFRGLVQFAIGLRHPLNWDGSKGGGSRGFESDNNTNGTTVANEVNPHPITAPIFSNVTLIGPIYAGKNSGMLRLNNQFVDGMRIRTNSSLSVFNSIEAGYPAGFTLHHWDKTKSPSVYSKAIADSVSVQNNYFSNNNLGKSTSAPANVPDGSVYPVGNSAFDVKQWLMQTNFRNDTSIANLNDLNLVYPQVDTLLDATFHTPNVMPKAGSPLLTGAVFTHPKLMNNLITGVNDASETNLAITAAPNPFSESTTISYSLLNTTNVSMTVYDLKGNVVREYNNGNSQAGTFDFNATGLAKGIYFAKAVTGSTVKTLKLVVK